MNPAAKFVLGFLFRNGGLEVALITKKRPIKLAGMLNGIGGKVDENEGMLEAMRREFREETDVFVDNWQHFAVMVGQGYHIDCFFSSEESLVPLMSVTDEEVDWYLVSDLPKLNCEPDILWLIPLAQSSRILVAHVKMQ